MTLQYLLILHEKRNKLRKLKIIHFKSCINEVNQEVQAYFRGRPVYNLFLLLMDSLLHLFPKILMARFSITGFFPKIALVKKILKIKLHL